MYLLSPTKDPSHPLKRHKICLLQATVEWERLKQFLYTAWWLIPGFVVPSHMIYPSRKSGFTECNQSWGESVDLEVWRPQKCQWSDCWKSRMERAGSPDHSPCPLTPPMPLKVRWGEKGGCYRGSYSHPPRHTDTPVRWKTFKKKSERKWKNEWRAS